MTDAVEQEPACPQGSASFHATNENPPQAQATEKTPGKLREEIEARPVTDDHVHVEEDPTPPGSTTTWTEASHRDLAHYGRAIPEGAVPFDFNVKKVLEHWPVAFAVRELIANALDEHVITGSPEPQVRKEADGSWHIEDFGRGLQPEHLLQHENQEKLEHPGAIGQFGIGLKDALAVLERRGIAVVISSRFATIMTGRMAKAGFPGIVTLHGLVAPPAEPDRIGTEVILHGASDQEIEEAKSFFLRYRDARLVERTCCGEVYERNPNQPAQIYVRGVFVAEEPEFLFSYNITHITPWLRRALNRERMHVGRRAYEQRISVILRECTSEAVLRRLAFDLPQLFTGEIHDELSMRPVAVFAAQALQARAKVLFVTTDQLSVSYTQFASKDGYSPVVVSEDVARDLASVTDHRGAPMRTLEVYKAEWDASFSYCFVSPDELTPEERRVWDLRERLMELVGINPSDHGIDEVLISQTTRPSTLGYPVYGQTEFDRRRIVIRRDRLCEPAKFCATFLHELSHAACGKPDGTLEFEDELTNRMGLAAAAALGSTSRQID